MRPHCVHHVRGDGHDRNSPCLKLQHLLFTTCRADPVVPSCRSARDGILRRNDSEARRSRDGEAASLATALGVSAELVGRHRSRPLMPEIIRTADLIIEVTRRIVVEQEPSRIRAILTIRKFARLTDGVTDAEVTSHVDSPEPTASRGRSAAALTKVSSKKGLLPPLSLALDDVGTRTTGRLRPANGGLRKCRRACLRWSGPPV